MKWLLFSVAMVDSFCALFNFNRWVQIPECVPGSGPTRELPPLEPVLCHEEGHWCSLVSFPDHFSPHGKNRSGERPIPFLFPPPECWRSNQVALRKWRIHGNNGDQESWAIEAVYRRLGYAGLKPDHKKAVRSFRNGRDVLRACQPWMDRLNASKIGPESLCRWKRCFFPESLFLGDQNLQGRPSLQRNVSGWRYLVPQ